MPIIEWNVGILIGLPEIDKQHRQLVQLLNETYDQFREGVSVRRSLVDEMEVYADCIFETEEAMMRETSYPGFDQHKAEHESFRASTSGFNKNFHKNKNISIELLWFLCSWVTHHLRETDAEFGRFLDIHNKR